MTGEDLAHKAKMNRTHLGEIERGEVTISYFTLLKISNALELESPNILCSEVNAEVKNFLNELN
ncbi:helix-turn-helix domain-containing protein [Alkalihalobacillus deserti]|uniref:helix-turn-helix domain-containing protein n=1 Tax=Alkalihalobacillus deserti TaxID=2879466 RepID=UPI001D13A7A6|nr:helix-turn-helix transcriptional regulator [Alkalihalobacillus deserti]